VKLIRQIGLTSFLLFAGALTAFAQVEKAVVETTGMRSCPLCDMALEVALARISGAERVALDTDKQTFTVFYKPNSHFSPKDLRDAAAKAKLEVTRIRVTTRGTVQDRDGYRYLASGQDRYALIGTTKLPEDEQISVFGIVDESTDAYRMQMKVEGFKRIKDVKK
jgi:hypothetical protein